MYRSSQRLIRVATDALLLNTGLILAFGIRYVVVLVNNSETINTTELFQSYVQQYLTTCWLLTLAVIGCFYMLGVYHEVRAYRQRFKALVIVQGVALGHLVYGFGFYIVPVLPAPPRGVVLLSWVLGAGLLLGVRLARTVFRVFESNESGAGQIKPDKPQHILVLGGAGYIGSMLVRQLLEAGYHVRLIDSLMYGDRAIQAFYKHPRFTFTKGDFRHIETVVSGLHGMDAVVHLGAIVGDPACAIDEDFSTEINLIATRMLAEACKGYGIRRFIFASTCSVYGASEEVLTERSALNPVSLYARTKIDSERILLKMADDTFAPTILRFATIYGLSPRPRFDLVVNILTAKAVREGEITIFGGDQWRPFVHVADAARSVVLALKAPIDHVGGEIFNVGSDDQNYTINQIGDLIQTLIPESRVIQQGSDVDRRNYRVSFEKISRILRFQPAWTIEQGVREIQTALENGAIADYYDPYFNNYKYLSSTPDPELRKLLSPWLDHTMVTEEL